MKNKTLLITLFFLVFLFPIVNAEQMDYDDDWIENEGTNDDAFVWGGGFIDVGINDLTSNADIVCWDWTDNGYFNHCYFENSVDMYECDDDYTLPGEDGQQHSPSYYYDGHCQLGDGWCDHTMETGNAGENWDDTVDALYFEDCDGVASYTYVDEETFYVVDRHMYDCDNGGSTDYDYEAYHSTWLNVDPDISCGDFTLDCDENHDGDADGENNVWTETGTPDNPCRILDGYECNNDDECISDDCDGSGIFYNPVCDYDGSEDYILETETYADTCGGDGDLQVYVETTYACTLYLGSGYICDLDLDETGSYDYEDFCKLDVGEVCTYDSDCWNDNEGYDCNNGYCSDCGDGLCSNGEDYNSCPNDCANPGACDNDYNCDNGEDPGNCPNDCVYEGDTCLYDQQCYDVNNCVHNVCRDEDPYCGDNYCDGGETCSDCSGDCGGCGGPEISVSPTSLTFYI